MKNWLNKNPKLIFSLGIIIFLIIGGLYVYFILLDNPKTTITNTEKTPNPEKQNNESKENLNLDLPEAEKSQIEAWLEENNYNQYGDKVDTIYAGGSPLFNESTGKSTLLYDYLVQKYPDKPWLEKKSKITENSSTNPAVKSFTEVKTWKNFENPNFELQYPDFANMSDKNTYPVKFTADNDFEFIIEVSDKQPNYSAGTCEKKLDIDSKSLYLCYNKNIIYQEIYQRMLDSFVIR
jgi:hypothetical protein